MKITANASVVRVYDGDTPILEFEIPVWIGSVFKVTERCRMAKINAPEMNSTSAETRKLASEAQIYLSGLIMGKPLTVNVFGRDNYGRPLVEVFLLNNTVSVNQMMIDKGYATKVKIQQQLKDGTSLL
jgi:endonuclease YncB( thermonuclease family)